MRQSIGPKRKMRIEELPDFISYAGMGILALLPIYFGSYASLPHPSKTDTDSAELLSTEDAYWFPILGSFVLFGFYLVFNFFSKDLVDILILTYFSFAGTATVYHLFSPILRSILHSAAGYTPREFTSEVIKKTTETTENSKRVSRSKSVKQKGGSVTDPENETMMTALESFFEPLEYKFLYNKKVFAHGCLDYIDVIAFVSASAFVCYYNYSKHWIASNVLGESFSLAAIQWMQLDSFKTGMILLAGLFFYDIFWVFGTDVMVTVATTFDAPIKILFPRDVFAEKYSFALLGLGDIVIPGICIALCLRYDYFRAGSPENYKFPAPYFRNSLIGYILGLSVTIGVMHTFKAAQPALLYLSPAGILAPLLTAVFLGDLKELFDFGAEAIKDGSQKQD